MPRRRFPVNPKLLEEIATMTGGTPYLATDTRALAKRFQDILEDLEKSRIQRAGRALRRAVPALPAARALLVLLLEIAAAPDPPAPVALSDMRLAQPQLLWLLLLVPVVVLGYGGGVHPPAPAAGAAGRRAC